ncbi:MAG: hypothetical protein V4773_19795 [Verrucomicrobiota bacterium]
MSQPGPIRFPGPKPSGPPTLSLRRRPMRTQSPFQVSEASAAARESIKAIVTATRMPFGAGGAATESDRVAELERTLRQLEASLAERERAVGEMESRQADRERDIAEAEALLEAREKLLAVTRKPVASPAAISTEEKAALEQLRGELEKQEASLKESKQSLREREQFLDESETKLFEKVQAQQEKEVELEQREEDLRARDRRLKEREAAIDPKAAAALKAEDEKAKQRDEFNE